jgi:hypothetical protein
MHRLLIFLAGCAFGYVLGGYVDGVTGDDECALIPGRKRSLCKTETMTGEP